MFVQDWWQPYPRLLFEAGTTYVKSNFQTVPQPENPLEFPSIREIRTNTTRRNRMGFYGQNKGLYFNASASRSQQGVVPQSWT